MVAPHHIHNSSLPLNYNGPKFGQSNIASTLPKVPTTSQNVQIYDRIVVTDFASEGSNY